MDSKTNSDDAIPQKKYIVLVYPNFLLYNYVSEYIVPGDYVQSIYLINKKWLRFTDSSSPDVAKPMWS
jgi:hypothetical protein